jgi:hypothetical protein
MRSTPIISTRKNNSTSLQTRLVLFGLFVALVPLSFIATRDTFQTQQTLTKAAETSLKTSAAQTANGMDVFIQTTFDSIAVEAKYSDFVTFLTLSSSAPALVKVRAQDLLNSLKTKAFIISYALVDTNGHVLLDTEAINVNNNESTEPYFPPVRISTSPIVTPVTYSNDKKPHITFASKIKNINGDYLGILRVIYDPAILQDVIVKSVGTSSDTSVLLLDDLHIRMADNQHPELILKSVAPLAIVDYLNAVQSNRLLDTSAEEQATNFFDFDLALKN